ncbi:MAG: formylglycine-generating enzyme family protein [Gemmatimonadetes bacterium]|nr:formylglycine-generating enzyme family protein [Gemmatimonadota bacterium]MYH51821.1 formylglycine-generating enzyme family protein [Gemmatimonadota bacterium]MYK66740.1 formylglycine-generating enzyme family protein [Gemmatimonadota bacterium]
MSWVRPALAQQVGQRFQDCAVCPVMVVLPPGSFIMGSPESSEEGHTSERPQHRVAIEYSFAVGVYEVTFAEWDACAKAGGCNGYRPSRPPDWKREGDRHPVVEVSWDDAWAYTAWLSRTAGEDYRLLSEAEWEYMARGGTQTVRHWGDFKVLQCRHANGDGGDVECSDPHEWSAPVGSFQANQWGLYDVLGNAYEWVEDCWHGDYAGAPTDGSPWRTGDCSLRVLRGGSWLNGPWVLRSAFRNRDSAASRYISYGFRVARTMN